MSLNKNIAKPMPQCTQVYTKLLLHRMIMYTYHIQTKRYLMHVKVDSYLKKFDETFDRFIEAVKSRHPADFLSGQVQFRETIVNDANSKSYIKKFIAFLVDCKKKFPLEIPILEDMIINCSSLLYFYGME